MATSSTSPAASTWPPTSPAATSTVRSPASSRARALAGSTPSTKGNGASAFQPSGAGRCDTTTTWSIPLGGVPPQPSVRSKTWRPATRHPLSAPDRARVCGGAGAAPPYRAPVRPRVVVGRLRHLHVPAVVQRDVAAGQPVEQRAGLVVL